MNGLSMSSSIKKWLQHLRDMFSGGKAGPNVPPNVTTLNVKKDWDRADAISQNRGGARGGDGVAQQPATCAVQDVNIQNMKQGIATYTARAITSGTSLNDIEKRIADFHGPLGASIVRNFFNNPRALGDTLNGTNTAPKMIRNAVSALKNQQQQGRKR